LIQALDLPAITSRQNGALCTTASSDAANEAFSSLVNGFAASLPGATVGHHRRRTLGE